MKRRGGRRPFRQPEAHFEVPALLGAQNVVYVLLLLFSARLSFMVKMVERSLPCIDHADAVC